MSVWSSSTGKAQLSYADRLRQANKTSAPTSRQAPASSSSSSSAHRTPSHDATRPGRSASTSSQVSASSPGHAGAPPSRTVDASSKDAQQISAPSPSQTGAAASVNVWEARRKQLAEREAEKERERQASLAQQRKAAPAASLPGASATNANASVSGRKEKQAFAAASTGSKNSKERHSKAPSTSSQSDKKTAKQADRAQTSASIPPSARTAASISDTTRAKPAGSASSSKTDKNGEANDVAKASQQSSAQPIPADKGSVGDEVRRPGSEEVGSNAELAKTASKKAEPASTAQNAAALVPPSRAPPALQTAPLASPLHGDIPASPATVASAIEEVLKNGAVHGAQTEDDDAWLARIHLLNGGQNMPNFGGFGPNGVLGRADEEEEAQAAKKAERAVAAAWGAGKSVWNKSQQQHQGSTGASKEVSAAPSVNAEGLASEKEGNVETASATVNGVSDSPASQEQRAAPVDKSAKTDSEIAPASKKSSHSKPAKSSIAKQATAPPSVPSFEDPTSWPSPLDAGKKPAEKPKAPSTISSQEEPKQQKSFQETLDELQLRTTTGAGVRNKGKQQWVSILPEITHASSSTGVGAKQSRTGGEGKSGKGLKAKEGRKDGGKSGQGSVGAKKEKKAGGKGEDKQGKEVAEGSAHVKSAEPSEAAGPAAATDIRSQATTTQAAEAVPTVESSTSSDLTPSAAPMETPSSAPAGTSPIKQNQRSAPRTHTKQTGGANGVNGIRPPRSTAASSSGAHTPTRQPHPTFPQPLYFGPSGVSSPMPNPYHLTPFYPPPPAQIPAFLPDSTSPLPSGTLGQLLGQIEFYFSQHNLQGDFFLRSKMDSQGWVEIGVVAGFKRVQGITREVGMVKDALLYSAVLDVDQEGMRVRRRFGWELYVLGGGAAGEVRRESGEGDDEPALGVVSASGMGGRLEAP